MDIGVTVNQWPNQYECLITTVFFDIDERKCSARQILSIKLYERRDNNTGLASLPVWFQLGWNYVCYVLGDYKLWNNFLSGMRLLIVMLSLIYWFVLSILCNYKKRTTNKFNDNLKWIFMQYFILHYVLSFFSIFCFEKLSESIFSCLLD